MMIYESELSDRKLAAVYNTTAKTINKWRNRVLVIDQPMGSGAPNSCLGEADQSFVKHYRLFTGFGGDECLLRLREIFPKLTRTSLYRCFARHGVGRIRRGKPTTIKQETAKVPAGHFYFTVHRTGDGSALFAAIEEGSGRIFTRRLEYSVEGAISFLKQLIEHFPEGVKLIATPHNEKVFPPPARGIARPSRDQLLPCVRYPIEAVFEVMTDDWSATGGLLPGQVGSEVCARRSPYPRFQHRKVIADLKFSRGAIRLIMETSWRLKLRLPYARSGVHETFATLRSRIIDPQKLSLTLAPRGK